MRHLLAVALFFFGVAAVHAPASADMGPKPTLRFSFDVRALPEGVVVTGGRLVECESKECKKPEVLGEKGPQRFEVSEEGGYAMAYGFRPFQRLELDFSDGKTRRSAVFEVHAFDAKYAVVVGADELDVYIAGHEPKGELVLDPESQQLKTTDEEPQPVPESKKYKPGPRLQDILK